MDHSLVLVPVPNMNVLPNMNVFSFVRRGRMESSTLPVGLFICLTASDPDISLVKGGTLLRA